MTNLHQAEYCITCPRIFALAGACPHPDHTILYSLLSMLPYMLIIYATIRSIFTRRCTHVLLGIMLVTAYIVSDKIIKNIARG